MIFEIGGQRLRRRRIDRSGLGRAELDVFDRALLVLESRQRLQENLRRFKPGRNRSGDLTSQRNPPLFGDKTLLAVTELPDQELEAPWVERAVDALEVRIAEDQLQGFLVGLSKPKPPRFFVERCFRDGLLKHLAVKPERAGLILRERTAELAADLLQPISIDLAELLGRYLRASNLGERRLPEASEDIGDAPNAETDDQDAHHRAHNNFAEPVR